nr:MAG TPA: tail tube protein [Caudoviricetes sp.]
MEKGYPTTINGFNVYKNGQKLIGVADEVTLPDFSTMTTSITGAGIAGSIDVPIVGFLENMDFQVPFRTLTDDMFAVMDPKEQVNLSLRGSIQVTDTSTGTISYLGMRVVVRGYLKSFSPGSIKVADAMNSSVTLSVSYILIEVDGKVKLEHDKFNSKFVVNGVDVMNKVRSLT